MQDSDTTTIHSQPLSINMHQHIAPLVSQRGHCPPRDGVWNNKSFIEFPQEGHSVEAHQTSHSTRQTIESALRNCAGIPLQDFALVVQLESGEEKYYSSQTLKADRFGMFADRFQQNFHFNVRRATIGGSCLTTDYSQRGMSIEFDAESELGHRKQSRSGDSFAEKRQRLHLNHCKSDNSLDNSSASAKRKRGSRCITQFDDPKDDTSTSIPFQNTHQLMIDDAVEVEKFYLVRFRQMQQSSCKVMGKVFVKLVEPKKQTHYPYTKGDNKAPPWWPNTSGENRVRHKEPDHLLRPERIRLLVHILRMVTEPVHKQCPATQKLGLNVKKLEDATMTAMSLWFDDKNHPENSAKRPYLKEIFKIARAEERFKNEEIDAATCFVVTYGDKIGQDGSDDELDQCIKDEAVDGDDVDSALKSIPTSETIVSPAMVPNQRMHRPVTFRDIPAPHSQSHIDYYLAYTGLPSFSKSVDSGFQPQNPTTHDSMYHSFALPSHQSREPNFYGWQKNMNNGGVSRCYITSPYPCRTTPTIVYQLPPANDQQNMFFPH